MEQTWLVAHMISIAAGFTALTVAMVSKAREDKKRVELLKSAKVRFTPLRAVETGDAKTPGTAAFAAFEHLPGLDDAPERMGWDVALARLATEDAVCIDLNHAIAEIPFPDFFWECSQFKGDTASMDRFQFGVTDARGVLARQVPSYTKFSNLITSGDDSKTVAVFMGGDSVIIAPKFPKGGVIGNVKVDRKVYGSIASFARSAPVSQQIELWKTAASVLLKEGMRDKSHPLWMVTDGRDVPWFHIRIDRNPTNVRGIVGSSTQVEKVASSKGAAPKSSTTTTTAEASDARLTESELKEAWAQTGLAPDVVQRILKLKAPFNQNSKTEPSDLVIQAAGAADSANLYGVGGTQRTGNLLAMFAPVVSSMVDGSDSVDSVLVLCPKKVPTDLKEFIPSLAGTSNADAIALGTGASAAVARSVLSTASKRRFIFATAQNWVQFLASSANTDDPNDFVKRRISVIVVDGVDDSIATEDVSKNYKRAFEASKNARVVAITETDNRSVRKLVSEANDKPLATIGDTAL